MSNSQCKFKVGDKIRLKKDWKSETRLTELAIHWIEASGIEEGEICEVAWATPDKFGGSINVRNHSYVLRTYAFELAEEEEQPLVIVYADVKGLL